MGFVSDNQTTWTTSRCLMLHDLNFLLKEEQNYESQTADLRVEQKYIDYCLEEIEELGMEARGYCGILRKRAQTWLRHLQHPCHCTLGS